MYDLYQIGGSLAPNAPTYIKRPSDTQLLTSLKRGEFCYVLNCRQMGKSSLLVRTRTQLEQSGSRCASIDLTRLGSEAVTPLQWYKGLVAELWRGFGLFGDVNLKVWWESGEEIPLLQRLGNFVEDILFAQFPDTSLSIFLDEIDSVLSLNFPADDLFAWVRFCYNQRSIDSRYNQLNFAIFGVATPSNLIRDRTRTPFNIGTAVDLRGFTFEEATPLLAGLQTVSDQPGAVLKEILHWTSGQPFLTQKLCRLAIEQWQTINTNGSMSVSGKVACLVRSTIVQYWETQDEPEHLRTIRNRILCDSTRAARLLRLYQQVLENRKIADPNSDDLIELALSGLVVRDGDRLRVKNPIYRSVFNQNWVQQQLDRLRPYALTMNEWVASNYTDESRLLRGTALREARIWSVGKRLSDLDDRFLAASEDLDRREAHQRLELARVQAVEAQLAEERKRLAVERKVERQETHWQRQFNFVLGIALVVVTGMGIFARSQYYQARIGEIQALVSSATGQLDSEQNLNALLSAVKAKRRLRKIPHLTPELADLVDAVLYKTILHANEHNRLSDAGATVYTVTFNPDATLIATGNHKGEIWLGEPDGTPIRVWQHSQKPSRVNQIKFSPDGTHLASVGGNLLALWHLDGTLARAFPVQPHDLLQVLFSPTENELVTLDTLGTVKFWHLDGTLRTEIDIDRTSAVSQGLAYSPDGTFILIANARGEIERWGTDGTFQTAIPTSSAIFDVEISPDGRWIAAACEKTVRVWNRDGKPTATAIGHRGWVWDVAFSPDSRTLASSSLDKSIKLWSLEGQQWQTLDGHRGGVWSIAFSPDGQTLISGSSDTTIRLWKVRNPFWTRLYGHEGVVVSAAFSTDDRWVATASADRTVRLWARTGEFLRSLKEHAGIVWNVEFSSQGQLISSSDDRNVAIGFPATTAPENAVDRSTFETSAPALELAVSPDETEIAVGHSDNAVRLYTVDGRLLETFSGHTGAVWSVAWSPHTDRLLSGGEDGVAKLWDRSGTLLETLTGHKSNIWKVAFSPGGQTMATGGADLTVKLWDREGTLLNTLQGHQGAVWGIDFSPNGAMLASSDVSSQIVLWNREGARLGILDVHDSGVRDVRFSPDGTQLVSSSDDNTAILWNLDRLLDLEPLTYACDLLQGYLKNSAELSEADRRLCDGVDRGRVRTVLD
ncbi:MAG: AAA-like domain-containing protein [Cyanobacteria bacterium SBC]|nr:AAA-like domain-containing protein [Cyanobacteria bacterium SBC]